jgi:hypothetical protein
VKAPVAADVISRIDADPGELLGDQRQGSRTALWCLRALALVAVVLVVRTGHAQIDRPDVAAPAYAVASGHLGAAYPSAVTSARDSVAFQAPGFTLVAGAVVAAWEALAGPAGAAGALTFAAYCTVALVVWAGGRLVRRLRSGPTAEVMFLVAVALSPWFRESLSNYFHPGDVMALGFMLLGLYLASEGRWAWAGAAVGFGIASKQWAVLALPVLAVVAPAARQRVRLGGAALAGAALPFVPFFVVGPRSAWEVLRGPLPVPGGLVPQTTVVGMMREHPFHVQVAQVDDLARALPLACAAAVAACWWLVTRRRHGALVAASLEEAIWLLVACFALRLVADCIALSYYALPLFTLLAIAEAGRERFPLYTVLSGFVLAAWYGTSFARRTLGPWQGAIVFTVLVGAVAAGAVLLIRGTGVSRPSPVGSGAGR